MGQIGEWGAGREQRGVTEVQYGCCMKCKKRQAFIFLELSWRSCLYIFEINPLSVASFAIIFSQSGGCLFTLLIVSFAVQKLLSFIRCHLFIFAFVSNILGCGS